MVDVASSIPKVDEEIQDELSKSEYVGLGVGIVHEGKLVLGKGYGHANLEKKHPITTKTVYRIGSISKLFTCIALFQQWEKGKFNLDDPVNDYLPKGKIIKKKKSWPDVTFKHILTHTSGIGEARRASDLFTKSPFPYAGLLTIGKDTPIPPLSTIHDLPMHPSAPAGQKYAYSNIAVSILGYLVELWSGENFRDYIVDRIMKPLGMDSSDFDRTGKVKEMEAECYKLKKGEWVFAKYWNNVIKPSGNAYTNLEDMAKFTTCLLDKTRYKGGSLLKPETVDMIWEPHYWAHESFKDKNCIGYIFRINEINGKKMLSHTGGLSGWSATFNIIPEDKLGFFTWCNRGEGLNKRLTFRVRNRMLRALMGISSKFEQKATVDKAHWESIKGHYGGYPGWLSNTRVITDGIQFKVQEREDHLVLSSLTGSFKKGVTLYPTDDPLVYEYPTTTAENYSPATRIAFTLNKENEVKEMARELFKLRKLPPLKMFQVKWGIICGLLGVAITISILLINTFLAK
ncbi:MAG: serine hydrolase domain-containing protein [Candidatus Hodarchaeota archaeon]